MNGAAEETVRVLSSLNVELALHHFGGNGPALLVCHASGFHAHCYTPMLPFLQTHFDVWGLDFRGHGASTPPDNDNFDWSGFADDVLAVIDHIDAPSIKAFGHSMGGASILRAAKQRPGAIDAAWMFEPIVFPSDIVPRNSVMAEGASKRRAEFDSKAEALLRYASRPPLGTLRADVLAAYVNWGFHDTEAGTVTLACKPAYEAATFNGAGMSVDDIRDLPLRVTIACGGRVTEGPNPADFAGPTVEALGNATLVQYDGLDHFGPLQDPERIAKDAVAFLA